MIGSAVGNFQMCIAATTPVKTTTTHAARERGRWGESAGSGEVGTEVKNPALAASSLLREVFVRKKTNY